MGLKRIRNLILLCLIIAGCGHPPKQSNEVSSLRAHESRVLELRSQNAFYIRPTGNPETDSPNPYSVRVTSGPDNRHVSKTTRPARIVKSVKQSGEPTDAQWWALFGCETGGTYNPSINTGNGYYGGFQFDLSTWESNGGTGYPHEHSYEEQREIAKRTWRKRGWQPWPKCSRDLGFR